MQNAMHTEFVAVANLAVQEMMEKVIFAWQIMFELRTSTSRGDNSDKVIQFDDDDLISRKWLLSLYENVDGLNIDNFDVSIPVIRQNIKDAPSVKININIEK